MKQATLLPERQAHPLLGRADRLEKLVNWSTRVTLGTTTQLELPWGLKVRYCANNDEPSVEFFWSSTVLAKLLADLQQPTILQLCDFGIACLVQRQRVSLRLLCAGGYRKLLEQPLSMSELQYLGRLNVAQDGIYFNSAASASLPIKVAPRVITRRSAALPGELGETSQSRRTSNMPMSDLNRHQTAHPL
jgi:hypothetical protein